VVFVRYSTTSEPTNTEESCGLWLCASCAEARGLRVSEGGFSLNLKDLVDAQGGEGQGGSGESSSVVDALSFAQGPQDQTLCPQCGRSLKTILKTGLAGCEGCYRVFSHRFRGGEDEKRRPYGGRLPTALHEKRIVASNLGALRGQLSRALSEEDYEAAAALRDRIRLLSLQGKSHD